jgi:hypothetical protein
MLRRPSTIEPGPDGSNPFSYPRLVQPVLDRHCVECHAKEEKAMDLAAGNEDGHFFKSYENLRDYAFFYDNASWTEPKTYPGRFGASASKLYQILRDDHYGVELSSEEMKRLTLWLDCNSDFYGAYDECERQRAGEIVVPKLE